jgi:hypothetical protein
VEERPSGYHDQYTFDFNGLTMQDVYDESLDFGELLNWTMDTLQNAAVLDKSPLHIHYRCRQR